jgi:hypothetical protein
MISFTSRGGAAGANCAASAQANAMGRMIFFIAITSGLAQICFSFKAIRTRKKLLAVFVVDTDEKELSTPLEK